MMRSVILAALLVGCARAPSAPPPAAPAPSTPPSAAPPAAARRLDYPGTAEGARALLKAFLSPGADRRAMSAALRPRAADFEAYFRGPAAARARAAYAPLWDAGGVRLQPHDGQTELRLASARTEDLADGRGSAAALPGGYRRVAAQLKPGLIVYAFKFVRPGETLGVSFDGLVYLNGRWVLFPKPWRVLSAAP